MKPRNDDEVIKIINMKNIESAENSGIDESYTNTSTEKPEMMEV